MRKRNVQILFRLTEEEAEYLYDLDTPMLREEAKKWHDFQLDVRKKYLLPKRVAD